MTKKSLFACIILFLGSCQFLGETSPKKDIEPIHFIRFDKDLLQFDSKNFDASESKMLQKYPEIYPFYIQKLLGIGVMTPKSDPMYYGVHFSKFLNEEYRAMMDTFKKTVFPKIPELENDITNAYSHLLYQFPEKKAPKLFSFFITPFGANPQAAFSYGKDTIGINWFNYLGKDFSLYESIYEGYSYMKEWNQASYMARNIMLVEYNNLSLNVPTASTQDELIYKMVDEGKKYYYLDLVIPESKDHTKIGYSEEQYEWCTKNELEIWAYFKENKLLYSTEIMDMKRYTQEGPSTPGMPAESPGMVGSWVGWQIVKAYIKNHPTTKLSQLLTMSSKDIVKGANYKPSK